MDKIILRMSRLRLSKFGQHYLYYPKYIGKYDGLILVCKIVEDKEYYKGGAIIYRTGFKYANNLSY